MAFSKALYFAAIVPSSEVKEKVKKIKLEIKEQFEAAHALKLPAHITLLPPVPLAEEQEKAFLGTLKELSGKQPAFPVKLRGFGHFKQRTLFINVEDHGPFQRLHENLLQKATNFLPPKLSENLHPHVTLATRDLDYKKFPKVWQAFKNRDFSAEFKAEAFTLFKHNEKTWDILENFAFSGRE
jgi:2'-5' RNA ligase